VNVEAVTARLVRSFGPGVADWCAQVPTLAAQAAARWGLTLGEPFPSGASSVVVRCEWPDGTAAVLKLSPELQFLASQVAMMRLLAPSGRVPAVLDADLDAGIVVMEAIRPGTMADELPCPPSARQWADLVAALHAIEIPAGPQRDLREICDEFFTRMARRLTNPAIAAQISDDIWNRAVRRCDELLRTQTTRVLLHGDLHPGNVLDGGVRGLVAIDPMVCVGDPCFDAVDFALAGAGLEGVSTRCAHVAKECGMDLERLEAWCRALAPLEAIGYLAGSSTVPAVTELLALAR
jgi:streptomycin 6-kinase